MQNNNNILTESEQSNIRLALMYSINDLEKLIESCKKNNIECVNVETQLFDSVNALDKLRKAFKITLS
jgi:ABC-type Zn uptake system ZnuABC Zn-binding protein ZnuA